MKNFITNNWFRLLIGISTLIFSVGFFIRSITPSYATNPNNTSNVVSTNGYAEGNYVYFIDNGWMYKIQKGDLNIAWSNIGHINNIYFQDNPIFEDPITKIKRKCYFRSTKITD